MLAFACGCRVECIELSRDYCAGAVLLNRLTGLDDLIAVHEGSALGLPFADNSFDVGWMQNVGMNIADKRKLYAEVCRVLKPGGRFAFQEMAAGETATSYFPLPWATDPADSFLVSAEEMRSLLRESGFITEILEDTSNAHLSRTTADSEPSPLTLGVYVDNLVQKAGNARRSLQEGQIRLVRGVFRVK
jgi:SAM-dependent methyltransferase